MAGTDWYSFTPNRKVKFNDINANFDWLEGAIVPNNSGTTAHNQYDVGDSTYNWRTGYFATSLHLNSVTITGADDSTAEIGSGNFRLKQAGTRGTTANSGGVARELAQGTISTPDLRTDAATTVKIEKTGSAILSTTIASVSITTTGGPVLLLAHCTAVMDSDSNGAAEIRIAIDRNSTTVEGGLGYAKIEDANVSVSSHAFGMGLATVQTATAGTYTYNLRYTVDLGTLSTIPNYALTAIEMKK